MLRGWAGYFHYRNSTSVMSDMKRYSRNRLRRWIWRKHACTAGLWTAYPDGTPAHAIRTLCTAESRRHGKRPDE